LTTKKGAPRHGALLIGIPFITRHQGNRTWIASQSPGTCQVVPVSLAASYPIACQSHSGSLWTGRYTGKWRRDLQYTCMPATL